MTGDAAVNGGDITTNADVFNLIDTDAETVNFAGAATTLNIGASSGTTAIANALDIAGALTANGNIDLGNAATDSITFNGSIDSNVNFLDAAVGVDYTLAGSDATGVNSAGGDLTVRGGSATGNALAGNLTLAGGIAGVGGTGNSIIFQTGDQALSTRLTIENDGDITQAGSGQVTFTGNVDTTSGLDVSGGNLTIAAANDILLSTGALDRASAGVLNIADATATSVSIGSGGMDSVTITTNSTGDSEVVLPNDSIGTSEILDNAVTTTDLAATLTFADGDFVDLGSITNSAATNEGLRLPQGSGAFGNPSSGEGYLAYRADSNALQYYDGAAWVSLASGDASSKWTDTGQITYLTEATDDLVVGSDGGDLIAPFSIDTSANTVRIGDGGGTTDGTLNIYANDGDQGTLTMNTSDQLNLQGADLVVDQALDVDGQVDLGDGGDAITLNGTALTFTANSAGNDIDFTIVDNNTNSFNIQQGANTYFDVNTTDGFEEITFGNGTTNPDFTFSGTGILNCTDCINFDDMANNMTLDESTTVNLDANNYIINLNATGEFLVQDGGSTVFQIEDADGISTFNDDLDLNLASTENLTITNSSMTSADLVSIAATITDNNNADAMQITITDNTFSSGTARGLVIETGNGSASIDSALAINHTDTGQAMTAGIEITGDASTVITTALDVDDPEIVTALSAGANDLSGTNWSITGASGNMTLAGTLAVNGDQITADGGTLTINAGGTVDIQDAVIADSLSTDTGGVSIAAGQSYTGAGAVTLSSGGAGGLSVNSASGLVTFSTDDDLIPTLGAGDADIGASGTRWDNIFATAGDFSGTVTAVDFACTDCLDFDEFANTMTVDETTEISLGGNNFTYNLNGLGEFAIQDGGSDVFRIEDVNGITTISDDVDLTLSGTENLAITSNLGGSVDVASLVLTPSASPGTTRGIYIQQANSSNTNGLDTAFLIDNADTNLAVGTAIQISNTGGGGYTTILDTPAVDISGSGEITVPAGTGLDTNGAGGLELGVTNATAITMGSSGMTTAVDGGMTVEETFTANGQAVIGDGGDSIVLSGSTITLTANGAGNDITTNLVDNNADALDIQQGTNNYLNITTQDTIEAINFGNASTNPDYSFLGSGQTTFNGNVDTTSGLDVTGADLTVGGANFSVAQASGNITTAGTLAVNGDQITADGATLVINAAGAVDVQDNLTADSMTTDTGGVTIAAAQSYTGVGAVTLSSGGAAGLTLDSASGSVTLSTDDDLLPTLGAGNADIGSSGARWDTIYGTAGDYSGTVTANDFACTDCLDFTEFSNTLTLDEATTLTFDTNNFTFNLNSTGEFAIQDGGSDVFRIEDADGISTFSDDVDFTLTNTENVAISSTLNSDVGVVPLQVTLTDNANTSGGTLYAMQVTNADNGGGLGVPDALVRFNNANANETVPDGLIIEQSAGGTMTNALRILESAGTITNGIVLGSSFAVGMDAGGNTIENIGDTGTDFTSGGGLNLAGTFDANGQVDLGDGGDAVTVSGTVLTFSANGVNNDVTFNIVDNNTDSFDLQQGTDNYLNINTTNGSEQVTLGNSLTNASVRVDIGSSGNLTLPDFTTCTALETDGSGNVVCGADDGAVDLQGAYDGGNSIETAVATPVIITETTAAANSQDLLQLTVNPATTGTFTGDAMQITMDAADANAMTGHGLHVIIDQSQVLNGNPIYVESDAASALFTVDENGAVTTAGYLAVNGDQITADGATLTINAAGAVDIQDNVTVDQLTTDTGGVSIPDGQAYAGAGAITLSSGGAGGITVNSADGAVTFAADDDLIPTLGAGDADVGASGTRWDNIYAVAGSYSGTVTATDFACTDCLNFTEFADNMTLDNATTIALSSNDFVINLDSTGEFAIQDGGTDVFRVDDVNGVSTFSDDLDVSLAGTENLTVSNTAMTTADLLSVSGTVSDANSSDIVQITITDNTSTSGNARGLVVETGNGAASVDAAIAINHTDTGQAMTRGLQITGDASTAITTAIDVSDPEIVTALSVGANDINGSNWSLTGAGTMTLEGTLAVNGDLISADGATLTINAAGTVDIQDDLNSDSVTTDTGGVTIAAGQSYTGAGAVTLSSGGAAGLTIDSASGTIALASNDDLTATGDVTLTQADTENLDIVSTLASDVSVTPLAISLTDNASASTGDVYGFSITNADNGANVGVPDAFIRLNNANANETVADGIVIEQSGGGTLTNALRIFESAGTITNGIVLGSTFSTGIDAGNNTIENIGVAGTDFTSSGGLNLAGALDANAQVDLGDGGDSITLSGTTVTMTANGAGNDISLNMVDNNSDAFDLQQGTNNYLNIDTTDGAETVTIGNSGVVNLSVVIDAGGSGNVRIPDFTSCTAIETDGSGNLLCGTDQGGSLQEAYNGGNSIETALGTPVLITETTAVVNTQDLLQLTVNPASGGQFQGDALQITMDAADGNGMTGDGLKIIVDASQSTGDPIVVEDDGSSPLFTVGETGAVTMAGALAVNGDSITADGATLTINAGGAVDVQDNLTADSLITDTGGVTIAGGQSYTGAGAVTLSSGGGVGLFIDSANGTITFETDDDLIPTLGGGTADIGSGGARWDNLYVSTGDFSGNVTAADFICTDCLDFTEFSNSMSVDEATTIGLGNFNLTYNLDGSGEFAIQDGGTDVFRIEDANGITTISDDVDLTLAGSENLNISNITMTTDDLVSVSGTIQDTNTSDVMTINVTDNTSTSGSARGLVIETGNGTANLDSALAIVHTDSGQAMTTGISISGNPSTAITTAIDVSDPEIVTALSAGGNDLSGTNWSITGVSGAMTLGGTLAVNGDAITADGATLTINAAGAVDIQDAVTVDSLTADSGGVSIAAGQSYTGSGAITLSSAGAGDITISSAGGNVTFGTDNDLIPTLGAANADIGSVGSPWDNLYVGAGVFSGTVSAGDFSCTDCLDFTEFSNSMSVDDPTTISLGSNNLTYNLNSTGEFAIQDGGLDVLRIEDASGITTISDDVDLTFVDSENLAITSAVSSDVSTSVIGITLTDNAAASTGSLYGVSITNADNGGNVGVPDALLQLVNANGNETVADGILIQQTGGGTLTNALRISETAGAITNGIVLGSAFSVGIDAGSNTIENIGDTGTDFTSSGGLTLAGTLDANGQVDLGDGGDAITISGTAITTTASSGDVIFNLVDANPDAFDVQQGTDNYFNIDTSNNSEDITIGNSLANLTVTVDIGASGNFILPDFTSCTAIETDGSGNLVCGTDDGATSLQTAYNGGNSIETAIGSPVLITETTSAANTQDLLQLTVNPGAGGSFSGDGLQITMDAADASGMSGHGLHVIVDTSQSSGFPILVEDDGSADLLSLDENGNAILSGTLAVNGDSITADGATLTINAAGAVDIQDDTTVDSLTVDTGGVSIAAGQSYTGAGAVTFSSGAGTGLTVDSGNGVITIQTDDDILPTLGAGDANFGSAGARWDNIYGTVGDFAGAVTVAGSLAANGGITFNQATDTVGAHTAAGTYNMNTNLIENIGDTGTDFVAGGGLNLAGALDVDGAATIGDGGDAITLSGTTVTLTANAAGNDITANLVDNNTDALDIQQGTNNYLNINTQDSSEAMSFGNASTNPDFSFLGSGTTNFVGNVDAQAGLDVTGGNLTVGGGNFSVAVGSGSITTAGTLAVNGDSITADGATLTINAAGAVDIQDNVTVDQLTTDTGGVSIAAGQSYTGAGAVTLSSGGATTLTIDSADGSVTFATDDDLIPTLGAGNADLGASGTRWDNLYVAAGDFSGTVTAGDFSCTDCLDFTEFADGMTLDNTTSIALGANDFTINVNSTGEFAIQDGGVDVFRVEDVNGISTFSDDVDFAMTDSENVSVASTLASDVSVTALDVTITDNAGASGGSVYGLQVTNADNAGAVGVPDAIVRFNNANAADTITDALVIEQSGGGTLTNALRIVESAGTITNGIVLSSAFGVGLDAGNNTIENIGVAGTDFTSGGGLTLAGTLTANSTLDANGQVDLGDGGDSVNINGTTVGINATGAGNDISMGLVDNNTDALDIQQGTDNYINLNTTNNSENITLGNSTLANMSVTIDIGASGTVTLSDFTSCTALETNVSGNLVCGSDDGGSLQSAYNGGNSIETALGSQVLITETTAVGNTQDLLQLTVNPATTGTFSGDALQITMDAVDASAMTGHGIHMILDVSQSTGDIILAEEDGGPDIFRVQEDGSITTTGTLAVNGDQITADGATLTINAGGAVDIQDSLTADDLTLDIGGVSIAGGQSYTGAGAVTLSSGGAGALSIDSASNTINIGADNDLIPGSGTTDLGSAGSRWDNIYGGAGNFSGTVTANDFSCTNCLDFTEIADALTLDGSTTVTMGGNGFTFNLSGTGEFAIQDEGSDIFRIEDTNGITTIGDDLNLSFGESENLDVQSTITGDISTVPVSITLTDNAGGSSGTLYALEVINADNAANIGVPDALVHLDNANAADTVTTGLSIEQSGTGTMTNGLRIFESAGTITNGIVLGSAFSVGMNAGNNTIENIGNAGTDFTSTGGLNLAGTLDADGQILLGDGGDSATIDATTITLTANGAGNDISLNMVDDNASAFDLQQGTDNYLNINTTNNTELMTIGNSLSNMSMTFDIGGSGNITFSDFTTCTALETNGSGQLVCGSDDGGSLQSAYDGGNTIETASGNPVVITETTAAASANNLLELTVNPATTGSFSGDALQITMDGVDLNSMSGNGLNIVVDKSQSTGYPILIEDDLSAAQFRVDEDGNVLAAGTLAVNGDTITSDGATLAINAAGAVDIQDNVTVDSLTADIGGVSIAGGQSYTGAGAVTLSSGGAGTLSLDSADGAISLATDDDFSSTGDVTFTMAGTENLDVGSSLSSDVTVSAVNITLTDNAAASTGTVYGLGDNQCG